MRHCWGKKPLRLAPKMPSSGLFGNGLLQQFKNILNEVIQIVIDTQGSDAQMALPSGRLDTSGKHTHWRALIDCEPKQRRGDTGLHAQNFNILTGVDLIRWNVNDGNHLFIDF